MEWHQLLGSSRLCMFEASGDSEADCYDHPMDGDDGRVADYDDEDEDDAQSCSCDSWEVLSGSSNSSMIDDGGGSDEENEEEEDDENWVSGNVGVPPVNFQSVAGREEEEDEEGVADSNEREAGGDLTTRDVGDRLFWERCLATGY